MSLPHCPKCNSEYTYEDNGMYICPECAYEWNDAEPAQESDELIVKDANGNLLADGDSVTIIKDLKVKGSSSMLKIGTKARLIRPTNSRTLRRPDKAFTPHPATVPRLIRPTNSRTLRRPDKAFTPHPATVPTA